jgi:hypothetical protein
MRRLVVLLAIVGIVVVGVSYPPPTPPADAQEQPKHLSRGRTTSSSGWST